MNPSSEHSSLPASGTSSPEGVAAPTLAVGGSRLWRVLYLYAERVRKAEAEANGACAPRTHRYALSEDSEESLDSADPSGSGPNKTRESKASTDSQEVR